MSIANTIGSSSANTVLVGVIIRRNFNSDKSPFWVRACGGDIKPNVEFIFPIAINCLQMKKLDLRVLRDIFFQKRRQKRLEDDPQG